MLGIGRVVLTLFSQLRKLCVPAWGSEGCKRCACFVQCAAVEEAGKHAC